MLVKKQYHGSVISSSEFKKTFPNRNEILPIPSDTSMFMPICVEEIMENYKYKLLLIGVLDSGSKVGVIINDIVPYFYVRNDKFKERKKFELYIKDIIHEKKWRGVSVTFTRKKSFNKYEDLPSIYARLSFTNIWSRRNALKYFIENIRAYTATNDFNNYQRVACRDSVAKGREWTMAGWNKIPSNLKFKMVENIKVPVAYINECNIRAIDRVMKDKSIVETWDIECYSSNHTSGAMPNPEVKKDKVFNISKTYHFKDSIDKILAVTFSSLPCSPSKDKLTVVCKDEKDLILTSFFINSRIKPDYIVGFNDHDFDWTFVVKKAKIGKYLCELYDLLNLVDKSKKKDVDSILKWQYGRRIIKISADTVAYSYSLRGAGYINIDTRTMLRKIYPTESKSSLKFYLEINKLGGKEDMPIKRLFKIFERSSAINKLYKIYVNTDNKNDILSKFGMTEEVLIEKYNTSKKEIAEVANYCVVDAFRCQELIQKLNIINDRREVANLSYTSLYDAIYYADGMKVRNLVIAKGQTRGLVFSTIAKQPHGLGKYPGAHVFYPDKGLVKPKLTYRERIDKQELKVSEEDIVSLEQSVLTGIEPSGSDTVSKLYRNFNEEKNKYPISGLDFSSLYPSIIMAYNLSPEYMIFNENSLKDYKQHSYHKIDFMCNDTRIIAWSIRHDTVDGVNLQQDKTTNKFGLYPTILKELFEKRKIMKKDMKKYAQQKEHLKKEGKTDDHVDFMFNYCNAKQKALKVFMNTFYGETGNKISPFFVLAIAGGITSAGQRNIKAVAEYVQNRGCRLYYGDTDSVYISCPEKYFVDFDKKYYSGSINKKDYCTSLVDTTFKAIEQIKVEVNDFLYKDNGTYFLRMAYEEVLYPSIFLVKKIYAGIEHQEIVNFYPDSSQLFIKGLSIKRRGTSKALRLVTTEVLMEILSIHNTDTVMEVIRKKIKNVYERKWILEDFKKTAVYKPNKMNISVRTFYNRMVERNDPAFPPPTPGDRFEYVIAKKYPFRYDLKGRKSKLSVGDLMEYYQYAKSNNIPIDLNYYMTGGIISQFSQFVAYHSQFEVPVQADDYDSAEKKTVALANKFIKSLCDTYAETPKCKGVRMKKLYKTANTFFNCHVNTIINNKNKCKMLSYNINDDIYTFLNGIVVSICEKSVKGSAKKIVEDIIKAHGINKLKELKKMLSTHYKNKNSLITFYGIKKYHEENEVRDTIKNNIDILKGVYEKRDENLRLLINKLDCNEEINDSMIDMSFKEGLDMMYSLYNKMININRIYLEYKQILIEIDFKLGINTIPPSINLKEEKKELVKSIMDF